MINKLTIETQWKLDPNKVYYVIQNPEIDGNKKKLIGMESKVVKYKVQNFYFTIPFIAFERIDKQTNKRFPEILEVDKRIADASNKVYYFKKGEKASAKQISYAVFGTEKEAIMHNLIRLHRLAEKVQGIYLTYKESKSEDTSITDLFKKFFNKIQDTNYFEQLEQIQTEFPDLAIL